MKPDDLKIGDAVWVFARQWYCGIIVRTFPAFGQLGRTALVMYVDDDGRAHEARKELREIMGADAFDRDPEREYAITIDTARALADAYWETKR